VKESGYFTRATSAPRLVVYHDVKLIGATADRSPHAPRRNAPVAVIGDALPNDLPAGVMQRATAQRIGVGSALHATNGPRNVRAPRPISGNSATFAAGIAMQGGEH
jgi:hypothetical protein